MLKFSLFFLLFVSILSKNILPETSARLWRCPGETCADKINLCLGSKCECIETDCKCKLQESLLNLLENPELDEKFYFKWDEITNPCLGYKSLYEPCEHSKFCSTKFCGKSTKSQKICLPKSEKEDIENFSLRELQSGSRPPPTNTKGTQPNPKTGPVTTTAKNTMIEIKKCKISMDCPNTQGCYEGLCVNWGSQCIGQGECAKGCCEGGYCQTDESVCNKYYSALTVMIISWIIFGFGFVNTVFWIIWYFVGRSKIISLTSIGGGEIPINVKSVVQGMPITQNNLMTNNLGQNISNVNQVPPQNNNQNKKVAKGVAEPVKLNNSYQNINNNQNVHLE